VLNNAPLARYIAPATKKRIEDTAQKTRLPAQRNGAIFAQQAQPQHWRLISSTSPIHSAP